MMMMMMMMMLMMMDDDYQPRLIESISPLALWLNTW